VGTVILYSNETSAVENVLALHKRTSEVTVVASSAIVCLLVVSSSKILPCFVDSITLAYVLQVHWQLIWQEIDYWFVVAVAFLRRDDPHFCGNGDVDWSIAMSSSTCEIKLDAAPAKHSHDSTHS